MNDAILVTVPQLPEELPEPVQQRLARGLERLQELGLWEVDKDIPRLEGRLAPIDTVDPDWPELQPSSESDRPETGFLGGSMPFRFWQCEALLNQATDLLERCTAERTAYDSLRERFASYWNGIQGFFLEDSVAEEEIKSEQRTRQRYRAQVDAKMAAIEHGQRKRSWRTLHWPKSRTNGTLSIMGNMRNS
jgi:hypothetical protein